MHYSSHNDLIRGLRAPGEQLERTEAEPYYKLIDAQGAAVPMYLPHTGNGGRRDYRHHTLYPKEKYCTDVNDDVFVEALLAARLKVKYTEQAEASLKACGAEYRIVSCPVCGGGNQKKLEYCPVEVVR